MAKLSKEAVAQLLQPYLDDLVERHDAVDGALVVTADGHLLAKRMDGDTSVKRLATMGSSLMSLGTTITGELKMGSCRNVIVENESGFAAFMNINQKLVLVSLTNLPNGLGMLLSASRACSTAIAKRFNENKTDKPGE